MTPEPAARVFAVASVRSHPNADNLDLVEMRGLEGTFVVGRNAVGTVRLAPGDLAVAIMPGSILPSYLIKAIGLWDAGKRRGRLASNQGNRVAERAFPPLVEGGERVVSSGLLWPTTRIETADGTRDAIVRPHNTEPFRIVEEGADVTRYLGIGW